MSSIDDLLMKPEKGTRAARKQAGPYSSTVFYTLFSLSLLISHRTDISLRQIVKDGAMTCI